MIESDISFVGGSARPSSDRMMMTSPLDYDSMLPPRLSSGSDQESRLSFGSPYSNGRTSDATNFGVFSSSSVESGSNSWSGSQSMVCSLIFSPFVKTMI